MDIRAAPARLDFAAILVTTGSGRAVMASQNYKAWSVVTSSTVAFTVCFMIWMMFAVIGIPIKDALKLNETQFGIVWVSLMWMYFTEVRPMNVAESRRFPEPTHFS
jgi:hypothetical protein